jgi:hypothetical protein
MPLNGHSVSHSQECVQQGAPTGRQEEEGAIDDEEVRKQQADLIQPKLKFRGPLY